MVPSLQWLSLGGCLLTQLRAGKWGVEGLPSRVVCWWGLPHPPSTSWCTWAACTPSTVSCRVRSAVPRLAAQASGLQLGWTVGQGLSVVSYTNLSQMSPAHPLCDLSGKVRFRDHRGACADATCLSGPHVCRIFCGAVSLRVSIRGNENFCY